MNTDPRVEVLARYISTSAEWDALPNCVRESALDSARELLGELDALVAS